MTLRSIKKTDGLKSPPALRAEFVSLERRPQRMRVRGSYRGSAAGSYPFSVSACRSIARPTLSPALRPALDKPAPKAPESPLPAPSLPAAIPPNTAPVTFPTSPKTISARPLLAFVLRPRALDVLRGRLRSCRPILNYRRRPSRLPLVCCVRRFQSKAGHKALACLRVRRRMLSPHALASTPLACAN